MGLNSVARMLPKKSLSLVLVDVDCKPYIIVQNIAKLATLNNCPFMFTRFPAKLKKIFDVSSLRVIGFKVSVFNFKLSVWFSNFFWKRFINWNPLSLILLYIISNKKNLALRAKEPSIANIESSLKLMFSKLLDNFQMFPKY